VEGLRHAAAESRAPSVAVREGADAVHTGVGACVEPAAGQRRLATIPPGARGGPAVASGGLEGAAQDPQRRCRGAVRGPPPPGPGFGVAMAGAQEPWGLVTTALDL
jgi:hypothetical protein